MKIGLFVEPQLGHILFVDVNIKKPLESFLVFAVYDFHKMKSPLKGSTGKVVNDTR